jgi:hypothetical protein
MKSRFFSIFFCLILFSIPLRMRAAECGIICAAVSLLPSAGQAGLVAVSGVTMYLGAYLGFRDAFGEQNTKGVNRVDRKVSDLEEVVAVQTQFNRFVASKLPLHDNIPVVQEFEQTLTVPQQVRFALVEVVVQ